MNEKGIINLLGVSGYRMCTDSKRWYLDRFTGINLVATTENGTKSVTANPDNFRIEFWFQPVSKNNMKAVVKTDKSLEIPSYSWSPGLIHCSFKTPLNIFGRQRVFKVCVNYMVKYLQLIYHNFCCFIELWI